MVLDKAAVIAATEQKILELAYNVSGRISLVRTRQDAGTGSLLVRFLRVINNPYSKLTYNEMQLVLQHCVVVGQLDL